MRVLFGVIVARLLLAMTVAAQSFSIQQVPLDSGLNAATSAGRGLSLVLSNSGQPYLAAYNSEGKLVFAEKDGELWNFTSITGDIVDGIIDDEYETSLTIYEDRPLIVYYDGSTGNLMFALRTDGVWSTATIDDGASGGNKVGGFPEVRLLQNGELRVCYQDMAAGDLLVANGNPTDGFVISTIDAADGSWCSFLSDTQVIYSQNDNVMLATYDGTTWDVEDTSMDGVQPVGGYTIDGDLQFFATQVKTHYGNNGVSDSQIRGFYKASGGSGTFYNEDGGAYVAFVPEVGKVFRRLSYSALFGSSSSVTADIVQSDGTYRYPIHVNSGCLPVIRHLTMAKSTGLIHVAYSFLCDDKQVIQYATLVVEENLEDESPPAPGASDGGSGGSAGSDDSGGSSGDGATDDSGEPGDTDDSGSTGGDDGAAEDPNSGGGGDAPPVQTPSLEEISDSLSDWGANTDKVSIIESAKARFSELADLAESPKQKKSLKIASKFATKLQSFSS
ncbi:MAG: hypothetical protein KDD62_07415, partial [Bdellovibrionales bacterium]|nr:hypothetical protein [Bdellovibrionales bacterium]